jgi:hypothetical protein
MAVNWNWHNAKLHLALRRDFEEVPETEYFKGSLLEMMPGR